MRVLQAEPGTASAKALGQDPARPVGGRRGGGPVAGTEGGRERERGRREGGVVKRAGWRGEEDLGFYPKGCGSPGRLWSEEGSDPRLYLLFIYSLISFKTHSASTYCVSGLAWAGQCCSPERSQLRAPPSKVF